jgi:3-oxoadipyl-CoA thiolase
LPKEVPGTTVNRLCGSGLEAVAVAARAIKSREASLLIAGGVESMSRAPFVVGKADTPFSRATKMEDTTLGWRFVNPLMKDRHGVDTMPETAENVAVLFGISRVDQDAYALRSQQRAATAIAKGWLAEEITSVRVSRPRGEETVVSEDEQPRPDTTLEALARLKGIVKPEGTVTAGNASGLNDGAGALLLASEEAIRIHGLTPRGRVMASAAAGVEPRIMGVGPVPAVRKVLTQTGLTLDAIDVFELNEAFAAQVLAVLRELGLPADAPQVNPNGGAIALGHPLGASGARLVTTALNQLRRTGEHRALCAMCIGVGQGIALIVERMWGRET